MLIVLLVPLFWWVAFRYATPTWYHLRYNVADAFPIHPTPDWLDFEFKCASHCDLCMKKGVNSIWMKMLWDCDPITLWRHGMTLRGIYNVYTFNP